MKKTFTIGIFAGLFALLTLPGCYTQLQSTRDRDYDDYGNYSSNQAQPYNSDTSYVADSGYTGENYDGTTINNYYGDGWHPNVGFSYYYPPYWSPSLYFSAAYYDPWAYGFGYYTPCYTCYPAFYPYAYYPPAYYYGGGYPYYYGNGYYNNYPVRHAVRTFGSTRGGSNRGGAVRNSSGSTDGYTQPSRGSYGTDGSSVDMPRAGAVRGGASTPPRGTSASQPPSRREGNRGGSYAPGGGNRGSGGESVTPRSGGNSGRGGSARPASGGRPHNDGGRSSAPPPSYNPPPSAPAPSAPAPSSSGGSGSGGGRSGGRRP